MTEAHAHGKIYNYIRPFSLLPSFLPFDIIFPLDKMLLSFVGKIPTFPLPCPFSIYHYSPFVDLANTGLGRRSSGFVRNFSLCFLIGFELGDYLDQQRREQTPRICSIISSTSPIKHLHAPVISCFCASSFNSRNEMLRNITRGENVMLGMRIAFSLTLLYVPPPIFVLT